jgi:hypothetical protein
MWRLDIKLGHLTSKLVPTTYVHSMPKREKKGLEGGREGQMK